MDREKTPYDLGFGARRCGHVQTACPYATGSDQAKQWVAGWVDQDEHLTERDEALASIGWFG